jgi:hypothetical protein
LKKNDHAFDYVNDVSSTKVNMFKNHEDAGAGYNPWLVNRSLSYSVDSVLFAQEMNEHAHLPAEMQHRFYLESLPARRRFARFEKSNLGAEVEALGKWYGINKRKAVAVHRAIGSSAVADIMRYIETVNDAQVPRTPRNKARRTR